MYIDVILKKAYSSIHGKSVITSQPVRTPSSDAPVEREVTS